MATPKFSLSYMDVQRLFELNPFGIAEFARKITRENKLDGFSFAVHTGLVNLRSPPVCSCGRTKSLGIRKEAEDNEAQGLIWICEYQPGNLRCEKKLSICSGTWIEKARTSWGSIFELCLHWFFQTPVTVAAGQTGVSKKCAVFYYNACRQICFEVVLKLDICIGGEGLHVELDESHLFRRKYRVGRVLAHEDVWVFGGICRETKEAFIELVPDRTGATLWPIIMRRVAPGTTILTDSARVYDHLERPDRGGFSHHQVNHRFNFVEIEVFTLKQSKGNGVS